MAHGENERLVSAWADSEFVAAIDALARLSGHSRSVLIRSALAQMALDVRADDAQPQPPKGVT